MKVLIGGYDLFGSVGGGQTYYRNLILRNPQVEFHYFRQNEPKDLPRPANVQALEYRNWYTPVSFEAQFDPGVPHWVITPFLDSQNLAKSVAGSHYDIVDIPDYYHFGVFLRQALRHHDVSAGRIALSMHGAISTSVSLNWGSDGTLDMALRQIERLQYCAADIRYFISEFYRDEWRHISPLDSHCLDPMWFFDVPKPLPFQPKTERPVLRFIGRAEKRKGPHLFIETAWWLPRGLYQSAEIIGPDCSGNQGQSASGEIEAMCRRRGLSIPILKAHTPAELARLFAERSVVFAPSIYDTLNLVALEALLSGCPTVVGNGAGVCRYLKERFPTIPFTLFETDHFLANIPKISTLLTEYDSRRAALEQAVRMLDTRPVGPGLLDIYSSRGQIDRAASDLTENWHKSLVGLIPDHLIPSSRNLSAAA